MLLILITTERNPGTVVEIGPFTVFIPTSSGELRWQRARRRSGVGRELV